jgi:Domain of unknown function (DUF4405)
MKIERDWATPLTIGTFGVLAVTGVLMFFHLDTGLNKVVHEWLSWLLVAGVGLHVVVNLPGFMRHLASLRGRAILGTCAAVLALSFAPLGGGDEPPFVAPMKALAAAPLPVLAQVAGVPPATLVERLAQAGVPNAAEGDSVAKLVGDDTRQQIRVLGLVMASAR